MNLIDKLAEISVEPTQRWVRVKFGGETIADSKHPMLLLHYGPGKLPTYFFSEENVRMDLLVISGENNGKQFFTVKVGNKEAEGAAWRYVRPTPKLAALQDLLTFEWHKMDAWYEEEEEIFVHARDPHKRVDVLPGSRHLKIIVGDEIVAETHQPHLLFETWLPTRYYIPRADVRMEMLQLSDLKTRCPYKGLARYWSVKVGGEVFKNMVWSYENPIPECPKIKGLVCFFNEKVDIYLDGELQARPITPWT